MSGEDEILLRMLEVGVVDVGSDDAKLEKLRLAVADIAAALVADPTKAIKFTMVAADPDVQGDDPIIVEAMTHLKKHWATVSNTFQSAPVAILRSMLLDAIFRSAKENDGIAVAFVNIARNVLPHVRAGDERPVWLDVVTEIEKKVDARATAEWSTPDSINIPPLKLSLPKTKAGGISIGAVDRKTLNSAMLLATGPHTQTGANPQWPNNPQPWGQEFSKRASEAIASAVDTALGQVAVGTVDVSTPLEALATAVTSHIQSTLAAFSGATAGLQRRTNLLWWKESLYSTTAHVSYRGLPVFTAVTLMAGDLFKLVPTYSPASVAAFLDEAIRQLPGVDETQSIGLLDILKSVSTSVELSPLRATASTLSKPPQGRSPVISYLCRPQLMASLDGTGLKSGLGVEADDKLTPFQWGTFVFRELQAARAVQSQAPAAKAD